MLQQQTHHARGADGHHECGNSLDPINTSIWRSFAQEQSDRVHIFIFITRGEVQSRIAILYPWHSGLRSLERDTNGSGCRDKIAPAEPHFPCRASLAHCWPSTARNAGDSLSAPASAPYTPSCSSASRLDCAFSNSANHPGSGRERMLFCRHYRSSYGILAIRIGSIFRYKVHRKPVSTEYFLPCQWSDAFAVKIKRSLTPS